MLAALLKIGDASLIWKQGDQSGGSCRNQVSHGKSIPPASEFSWPAFHSICRSFCLSLLSMPSLTASSHSYCPGPAYYVGFRHLMTSLLNHQVTMELAELGLQWPHMTRNSLTESLEDTKRQQSTKSSNSKPWGEGDFYFQSYPIMIFKMSSYQEKITKKEESIAHS